MLTHPGPCRLCPSRRAARPEHTGSHDGILVVGAHRQAGTTTLATLLPARDLGFARDFLAGHGTPASSGRLILVTRSTAWAAPMATAAAQALTSAGHRIDILAIISDGWPDSPQAAARFAALAPLTGTVIRIPHVPALRKSPVPASRRLPRRYRRALTNLLTATRTHP